MLRCPDLPSSLRTECLSYKIHPSGYTKFGTPSDLPSFSAILVQTMPRLNPVNCKFKIPTLAPLEIEFYQPYSLENASRRVNKALTEAAL